VGGGSATRVEEGRGERPLAQGRERRSSVDGRAGGKRKGVGGEEEDKAGPRRLECSEGERPQECERGSLQSHFAILSQ
jgi:hypothetical protein